MGDSSSRELACAGCAVGQLVYAAQVLVGFSGDRYLSRVGAGRLQGFARLASFFILVILVVLPTCARKRTSRPSRLPTRSTIRPSLPWPPRPVPCRGRSPTARLPPRSRFNFVSPSAQHPDPCQKPLLLAGAAAAPGSGSALLVPDARTGNREDGSEDRRGSCPSFGTSFPFVRSVGSALVQAAQTGQGFFGTLRILIAPVGPGPGILPSPLFSLSLLFPLTPRTNGPVALTASTASTVRPRPCLLRPVAPESSPRSLPRTWFRVGPEQRRPFLDRSPGSTACHLR